MTRGTGANDQKLEKHFQKQMGCMAGFLHIFDRHHSFPVKRLNSTKPTEPETNGSNSPAESTPEAETTQEKPTVQILPVFDFKEGTRSSWKFAREAPRLSLDSRAVMDAKGTIHPKDEEKRRRSTSVVAKLMGLEDSDPNPNPNPNPKLQRSASESTVHRDLSHSQQYRFFDTTNFQLKQFQFDSGSLLNGTDSDLTEKTEPVRGITTKQKKCFYDSADFFPGPKQSVSVSVQGEIEKRLKMRGIHEPSKDLETLKQILEALQLKGLLHSKKLANHKNFVIENGNEHDSPIVLMKPGKSIHRTGWTGTGNNSPPPVSTFRSNPKTRTDHNQPNVRNRNTANSPTRSPNRVRKVTSVETERKVNDSVDRRRVSPVRQSPIRSPRMRKVTTYQKEGKTMAEDELSTVSDNSFSNSSHTDTERLIKVVDQYREGKELLQRCDKLLNSIAEITELQQPSPVSILDSSFYKDDSSCSPSPVMKRCIEYKDLGAESEEDAWSTALSSNETKSEDSDFVYVSEVLRASNYLSKDKDNDMFLLLEQQQYLKGNKNTSNSKVSTLQRKLIFDTIHEILNCKRRLPPWKLENLPSLHQIWSEFRRIREREESSEDMFEVICGVLKKDMKGENEWGECHVEIGDVVLDIERFIFKDLICETIGDLALCRGVPRNKVSVLRRKLEFYNN
ncbi:protein LONGIFOLIA 1-like [Vicia villosa]|uniref:protein LONGIFOLIA 1-like n=1 Tax=Vicia villosa TaxID=3911 RepID=UPI00273AED18|nr:protein LONGIFOLIA 1-like [Vicia villosa]